VSDKFIGYDSLHAEHHQSEGHYLRENDRIKLLSTMDKFEWGISCDNFRHQAGHVIANGKVQALQGLHAVGVALGETADLKRQGSCSLCLIIWLRKLEKGTVLWNSKAELTRKVPESEQSWRGRERSERLSFACAPRCSGDAASGLLGAVPPAFQPASIAKAEAHWKLLFVVFQMEQVTVLQNHPVMTAPE
jgi:hypothetical protein